MVETFFEQPILNSPYEAPTRPRDLDEDGQPTNLPPIHGRRCSKMSNAKQQEIVFENAKRLTDTQQEYKRTRSSTRSGTRSPRAAVCRTQESGNWRRRQVDSYGTGATTSSRGRFSSM